MTIMTVPGRSIRRNWHVVWGGERFAVIFRRYYCYYRKKTYAWLRMRFGFGKNIRFDSEIVSRHINLSSPPADIAPAENKSAEYGRATNYPGSRAVSLHCVRDITGTRSPRVPIYSVLLYPPEIIRRELLRKKILRTGTCRPKPEHD